MLPVSAWPPGPPGAALSPFGRPRQVSIFGNGFVIPKGAWIVATQSNQVVMFYPPVINSNPARTPGTGQLSQEIPRGPGCPPCGPKPPRFPPWNQALEDFRAWQRETGDTFPPLRSSVGRRPPNWFGWMFVPAPQSTLVPPSASGLVVADGQNVVITGSGFAQITQAYSV
jgi:hypothetical protein